jgi:predicted RNase H-like HicB family nuclease
MRALLKFELEVPVEVHKGSTAFIARCPIFDVSSQGKTPVEAKKNLVDALFLFVTTCFEMGTLDEVMKECGFKPRKAVTGKFCLKKDQELLSVPLPFMVSRQRHACHA